MIPLSGLDLSPIVQGGSPALAFRHKLELAQHAERLGYFESVVDEQEMRRPQIRPVSLKVTDDFTLVAEHLA
jgi:hypothetical protein